MSTFAHHHDFLMNQWEIVTWNKTILNSTSKISWIYFQIIKLNPFQSWPISPQPFHGCVYVQPKRDMYFDLQNYWGTFWKSKNILYRRRHMFHCQLVAEAHIPLVDLDGSDPAFVCYSYYLLKKIVFGKHWKH